MTEIICPSCGGFVRADESAGAGSEQVSIRCPGCGGEIRYRMGSPALTSRFTAVPVDRAAPPLPGPLDRTLLAPPGIAPPPPLRFDGGAFLLVIGGEPGRERLPLPAARTIFGREEADVDLGDPAVSNRHFQVEAAGREFFIRDLGSRNGTFVNGRRIRYAELLPGDEILAGSTYLVFRTSEDGLAATRRDDSSPSRS